MMTDADKMVSGRKVSVWHANETNTAFVEGLMSPNEAWEAGFGWEPAIEPVKAPSNNGWITVPGQNHVVRDDMGIDNPLRFLATGVTGRFSLVSNLFCCQLADSLVQGGHAKIDTAGSMYGGGRVYVTALLQGEDYTYNVKDDTVSLWVVISTRHDGKGSAIAMITPVRVVCHNTLTYGISAANHIVRVSHVGKAESRLANDASSILGAASEYCASHKKVMQTLANHRISTDDAVKLLSETAIPGDSTNANNQRARVMELFGGQQIGSDQDAVSGTLYGLVNAWSQYVETESTVKIHKPEDGRYVRSEGEARFDSTFFGPNARKRDALVTAAVAVAS